MKKTIWTIALMTGLCFVMAACNDDDDHDGDITDEGKNAVAVDMGLSVKWADRNVGAASVEGYGGLYGWADPTGTKVSITISDYPNDNPPLSISGTEYDIARKEWGGTWRMPTLDEQTELCSNCTAVITKINGIAGMKFTSNKNGNSIFLPFAGDRWGTEILNRGSWGDYWSGTRNDTLNYVAYKIYISYNGLFSSKSSGDLFDGFSVRAVMP
jgi:hypothetical protein